MNLLNYTLLLLLCISQVVVATHIVADDGNCTLPDAIQAANNDSIVGGCDGSQAVGADLIVLKYDFITTVADTTFSTFQYGAYAALPNITTDITIQEGDGFTVSIERDVSLNCDTADQVDEFRLLQVLAGGHLTLDNIDIKNGCADAGGGVLVLDGQLTTKNSSFLNNTARIPQVSTSNSGGGAMGFFNVSAIGQIETTVFQDNMTVTEAIVGAKGGAIKVELANNISIIDSDFNTNKAMSSGANPQSASGGALSVDSATINISGSVFISNQVSGSNASGGAIYINLGVTLGQLSNSEFHNNQTLSITADSKGGALFLRGDNALLSNLVFTQNDALGGMSSTGIGSSSAGGGIYNSGANNSITNAYFIENQAIAGDGTRGGSASGGSLYADPGMILTNITFENNSAQGGNGSTDVGGLVRGGGLFSCELPLSTGVTFSGNQAIAGNSISAIGGDSQGGGVYVDCGSFNLQNSTFVDNKAIAGLGSVSNGMAEGGGLEVGDSLTNIGSSIFENNFIEVAGVIVSSDCHIRTSNPTSLMSQGYNLIGDTGNCGFTAGTDQVGVSASLLALTDNGCGTPLPDSTCLPTHGIDIVSNALDQGSCASSAVTTDARGYNRPYDDPMTSNADDGCDVGAFEFIEEQVFADGFE